MNQLTDIQIIECNRQASNEIRPNDLENTSSWRNNLTDVIHLEAGDKVSVYSSFISVDGAGQTNTMDLNGKSLGVMKTLTKTTIASTIISDPADPNYNIAESILETSSQTTKDFEVRDNEINMVVGYYKNMDLDGYVQLPRRFVKNYETTDNPIASFPGWAIPRHDTNTEGRCLSNPWACYMDSDYKYFLSADGTPSDNCLKLRNNGSRYSLMIRNVAHLQKKSGSNDLTFPSSYQHGGSIYSRDPENALYFQYKEIKTLKIPKGFNSAEYVATELTRQLQEIENDSTFTYKQIGNHEAIYKTYSDFTTTKLLESNTYKGFNCGTIGNYEKEQFDASFITAPTGTEPEKQKQCAYYQNYQYLLMKRPDLYEAGQKINSLSGLEFQGQITETPKSNQVLELSLSYTEANLKKFKDFFEVQEKYPEIWAENNLRTADTQSNFYVTNSVNSNNSRYLHMNRTINSKYRTAGESSDEVSLGFSYYKQTIDTYDVNKDELSSQVIFTYYDPLQKDIFYDTPDLNRGELTYGFASRNTATNTINLHPNLLKKADGTIIGLPAILFIGGVIESSRHIGFDYHWNAYGNATIMLWDGRSKVMASADIDRALTFRQTTTARPEKITHPFIETVAESPLNPQFNTKSYLGSDATKVGYDGTHFFFSNFHTPKNVGTTSGAGSDLVHATSDTPIVYKDFEGFVDDASKVVYKMNVKDDFIQFSPVRIPYQVKEKLDVNTGNNSKYLYQRPNINQDYYSIFDSICGLTIEDFGIDEPQWRNSLWGLMGFSYEQLHSTNNVRNERIGSNNINNLNIMTTNAEIPIGDSKIFNQNPFGQSCFNNQLTQPLSFISPDGSNNLYLEYPTIQQSTESIKILAQDFPVSMARGYYSIRSDIISESHFMGGRSDNTIMPIVGVVDKMNAQGDFYFGTESSLQFTMTGKRVLSSINVSLHDPDGSRASVGEYSSILFKIEKPRKLTYNIAQELLLKDEEENKGKKR